MGLKPPIESLEFKSPLGSVVNAMDPKSGVCNPGIPPGCFGEVFLVGQNC